MSFYFRQSQISLRFLQRFKGEGVSCRKTMTKSTDINCTLTLHSCICSPKSYRHLTFHKLICPCFQTYILVGCLDLVQHQLLPAGCFTVSRFKIDFQNQAGSTHYMSPICGSVYWVDANNVYISRVWAPVFNGCFLLPSNTVQLGKTVPT